MRDLYVGVKKRKKKNGIERRTNRVRGFKMRSEGRKRRTCNKRISGEGGENCRIILTINTALAIVADVTDFETLLFRRNGNESRI